MGYGEGYELGWLWASQGESTPGLGLRVGVRVGQCMFFQLNLFSWYPSCFLGKVVMFMARMSFLSTLVASSMIFGATGQSRLSLALTPNPDPYTAITRIISF
jgi:hypothetical protein